MAMPMMGASRHINTQSQVTREVSVVAQTPKRATKRGYTQEEVYLESSSPT